MWLFYKWEICSIGLQKRDRFTLVFYIAFPWTVGFYLHVIYRHGSHLTPVLWQNLCQSPTSLLCFCYLPKLYLSHFTGIEPRLGTLHALIIGTFNPSTIDMRFNHGIYEPGLWTLGYFVVLWLEFCSQPQYVASLNPNQPPTIFYLMFHILHLILVNMQGKLPYDLL